MILIGLLALFPLAFGQPAKKVCAFTFECPSTHMCVKGVCEKKHANIPKIHLNIRCEKQANCPPLHECVSNTCFYNPSLVAHLQNVICAHDYQCPPTLSCDREIEACTAGVEFVHLFDRTCKYDHNCPSTYTCQKKTCYLIPGFPTHIENKHCNFQYNCPLTYECRNTTCYYNASLPQHVVDEACSDDEPCKVGYYCDQAKSTCFQDKDD